MQKWKKVHKVCIMLNEQMHRPQARWSYQTKELSIVSIVYDFTFFKKICCSLVFVSVYASESILGGNEQ